jgi:hypothetical protein
MAKNYKQLGDVPFHPVRARAVGIWDTYVSVVVPVETTERVMNIDRSEFPESMKDLKLRDFFELDLRAADGERGEVEIKNPRLAL